jgi:hypothetical protein
VRGSRPTRPAGKKVPLVDYWKSRLRALFAPGVAGNQACLQPGEIFGGHLAVHDIVRRSRIGVVPLRRHTPPRRFAYPCACFRSVLVTTWHFASRNVNSTASAAQHVLPCRIHPCRPCAGATPCSPTLRALRRAMAVGIPSPRPSGRSLAIQLRSAMCGLSLRGAYEAS